MTTILFQLTEGTTWQDYLGNETDPKSRIMIRFPDGRRESKNISCSSQFMVSKDNYHVFFYKYLLIWKYRYAFPIISYFVSGNHQVCCRWRISPRTIWNSHKFSTAHFNGSRRNTDFKRVAAFSSRNRFCSTTFINQWSSL